MAALGRLLIIGGSGFIGRHLCRLAAARGFSVTTLQLHAQPVVIDGVRQIAADLTDPTTLGVLRGDAFDYIVHCAGYIDHKPYFSGGRTLIASHFGGLLNLLDILDRSTLRRFIQIGSSDEYGAAPAPQIETMREAPIAPYSAAKTAATHLLQTLWRNEKFPAVILRLFLVYGPEQNAQRFLPQIIAGCLKDGPFPVSAGGQLRDFCYIDDVVDGILKALEPPRACGEVINLGSGQGVSIRQMIEQVRTLVGKGQPEFGKIPYRPGENMALWADVEKARQLLDWSPQTKLVDGLSKTVAYYKEIHEAAR